MSVANVCVSSLPSPGPPPSCPLPPLPLATIIEDADKSMDFAPVTVSCNHHKHRSYSPDWFLVLPDGGFTEISVPSDSESDFDELFAEELATLAPDFNLFETSFEHAEDTDAEARPALPSPVMFGFSTVQEIVGKYKFPAATEHPARSETKRQLPRVITIPELPNMLPRQSSMTKIKMACKKFIGRK